MNQRQRLRVLITVKTYPIPSAKYEELVCTAGVTAQRDFVRLYPINFRELPFDRQYRKYQWIEIEATKHSTRDSRKESYRPDCDTLRTGQHIPTKRGDWSERAKYVLTNESRSMEDLWDQQARDRTSLGIFRPKKVHDLLVTPDDPQWKPAFRSALRQAKLFDTRRVTLQPPRKVPFKFRYLFECDDERCSGRHRMMIEDWELGRLFWRLVDNGESPKAAAAKVRDKFLLDLCGPAKETYFYVGTILAHPTRWVIIGLFHPKKGTLKHPQQAPATLF